ncbi:histidine kinase [Streptomonospora sp. S1-112]|uniref:Histidine kinase n=1 Tax=Streptomonospora mangrovi TaxID=2883123 RepID=A0A9X3NQH5_9ACTN|nr:histidine kinase [Streptomonospora mangrovi]MDA0566124.1 histidine kinase [Streptomonospora mangrovi]
MALYDVAALAGRIAAAWIVAEYAWGALPGWWGAGAGPSPLGWAVVGCAAAFAAGAAPRVSGAVLAAVAVSALGPPVAAAGAGGAAGPWWVAAAALCVLGAVRPGRLALGVRPRRRGRAGRGPEGARTGATGARRSGRRPDEAPPLPYPGGRAAFGRPSRT